MRVNVSPERRSKMCASGSVALTSDDFPHWRGPNKKQDLFAKTEAISNFLAIYIEFVPIFAIDSRDCSIKMKGKSIANRQLCWRFCSKYANSVGDFACWLRMFVIKK